MSRHATRFLPPLAVLNCLLIIACQPDFVLTDQERIFQKPSGNVVLCFAVASDMRGYAGSDRRYFRGVCERIRDGGGVDFMISAGDIDPPWLVHQTILDYIGSDTIWYPVVGNHESETAEDMAWLRDYNADGRALPAIINVGPPSSLETTYAFEYGNAHFVVLNQYDDGSSDTGTDGDVADGLFAWLAADLFASTRALTFVIGHEPAYPLPDELSGRLRHELDSLNAHADNRDRFWKLLADSSVMAYICGHTHNYSRSAIDAVWQIDSGHARGSADSGAKSTFLIFYIMDDDQVWLHTYRQDAVSQEYRLDSTTALN
jgi:predicted phosphodiesterase